MNHFVQSGVEREQAMKTDDVSRKHAANATRGRFADFLFVGLGIVPLVLLVGGLPGIALLLFIPLLFVACLYGMWEQVGAETGHSAGESDGNEGLGGKTPATGVSLRKKL
jgi:ABC-type polysaccharide/polyol phosphate export permease